MSIISKTYLIRLAVDLPLSWASNTNIILVCVVILVYYWVLDLDFKGYYILQLLVLTFLSSLLIIHYSCNWYTIILLYYHNIESSPYYGYLVISYTIWECCIENVSHLCYHSDTLFQHVYYQHNCMLIRSHWVRDKMIGSCTVEYDKMIGSCKVE